MDMRLAAEVPDERRTFQTPVVPDSVFAKVTFLVKGESAGIQTALDFQATRDFVLVGLAERFQQQLQDGLQVFLLVRREVGDGDAVELSIRSAKPNQLFGRHAIRDQRLLALFAVEYLVQLVGCKRLMPEDVGRVVWLLERALTVMRVEDWSAECDVFGTVAIAPQRHVAAGEDKLKLVSAGLSENSDRLAIAESADIVFQLLVPAFVPVFMRHALKDVSNQLLLVGCKKTALDGRLCNLPVVFQSRPQQTLFSSNMTPVETDSLSLSRLQCFVQNADECFGRLLNGRGRRLSGEKRQARCRQGNRSCLFKEVTSRLRDELRTLKQ